MGSVQELQRVDRELFSELIETPINPAFVHMSTPFVDYWRLLLLVLSLNPAHSGSSNVDLYRYFFFFS